jgi:hypothetical protein
VPEGGCCSDIDCWVYSDENTEYYCCNGPGCALFDEHPFTCYFTMPGTD